MTHRGPFRQAFFRGQGRVLMATENRDPSSDLNIQPRRRVELVVLNPAPEAPFLFTHAPPTTDISGNDRSGHKF